VDKAGASGDMIGLQAFDEVKRAIVVCAHADDMETMMGATCALLSERAVELFELILTCGDLGSNDEQYTRDSLAAIRVEEARAGGEMLGFREVVSLDNPDGELQPTLEVRAQVAHYYRRWQPDTLFTFDPSWSGQIHPDHLAAGRAAIDALMPSKMRLYHPEQLNGAGTANIVRAFLFGPREPSVFVDATKVYDRKVASALAHKSQFPKGDENLDWMRELDRAAAERAGLNDIFVEQFAQLRVW
jgi:LmbE family N-acetylglucosaminyl deacetylase